MSPYSPSILRPRTTGAYVLLAEEGERLPGPAGGPLTLKARAETTNGSLTAFENVVAPGQGPGLHLHVREDEMYYVLAGALVFQAGERRFDAPTGAFVFIPRGTPHCFANITDDPARMLVLFTPAGMERFFEAHAALPPGPIAPHTFHQIARAAWMEPLGPPIAPAR
jgi:quercetin dioxygenase-like cupin family protein